MSTSSIPSNSFDPYQLGYFLFANDIDEYACLVKFLCQKINACSHANIDSPRFQSSFSQYRFFLYDISIMGNTVLSIFFE